MNGFWGYIWNFGKHPIKGVQRIQGKQGIRGNQGKYGKQRKQEIKGKKGNPKCKEIFSEYLEIRNIVNKVEDRIYEKQGL